jgi:hypothetical protein
MLFPPIPFLQPHFHQDSYLTAARLHFTHSRLLRDDLAPAYRKVLITLV